MTTLIRMPDQFTPGAGTVATAATPTCCCCCCCVASVVTTSVLLAEGLQTERRNLTAVVLIMLGPVIAVAPVIVGLLARNNRFGDVIIAHFGAFELIALLVAIVWTAGIAAVARSHPLVSLGRFGFGLGMFGIEFAVALFTALGGEGLAILLIPLFVILVHRYYRERA